MNNLQRRKRAFMSIITRPLGFVRSVSGTLPLSLPYATEGNVDGYTIEGKSVQDGTPSPENPIEIKSVGVKTVNLIDYTKRSTATPGGVTFMNNLDGTFTASGMMTSVTANYSLLSAITEDFEVGAIYTFGSETGHYDDNGVRYWMTIAIKNTETNTTRYVVDYAINTFTLAENEYVSVLDIRLNSPSGTLCEVDNVVYKPFIYKGECEPKFEPYGKYKLNIVNKHGNLFNSDKFLEYGFVKQEDGSYYLQQATNLNNFSAEQRKVFINDGYTGQMKLSFDVLYSATAPNPCAMFYVCYTDGTRTTNMISKDNIIFGEWNEISFITPENKQLAYVQITYNSGLATTFRNVMITPNIDADYEPYRPPISTPIYLDEPLRGIGDYKDKIDFERGSLNKRVWKESLSEYTWKESGSGDTKFYYAHTMPVKPTSASGASSTNQLSNFLSVSNAIGGTTTVMGVSCFSSGIVRARPDLTIYDTLEKWQEYMNSNECYVIYEIEPITEQLILPNLPIFEGTNILSIDGDIQPEMTVIYKASVKEV